MLSDNDNPSNGEGRDEHLTDDNDTTQADDTAVAEVNGGVDGESQWCLLYRK